MMINKSSHINLLPSFVNINSVGETVGGLCAMAA